MVPWASRVGRVVRLTSQVDAVGQHREQAQKAMEQVLMGETKLENVFDFPYLRRVLHLLEFNNIYPEGYPEGTTLMDAPLHDCVSDLIPQVGDHAAHTGWNLTAEASQKRLARV